jgi:L1 cell adhesion molecule like protein
VEILANDQGNKANPSVVALTDTEHLVGDGAKDQMAQNPSNTVFNTKRQIGRMEIKHWPFKAVNQAFSMILFFEF